MSVFLAGCAGSAGRVADPLFLEGNRLNGNNALFQRHLAHLAPPVDTGGRTRFRKSFPFSYDAVWARVLTFLSSDGVITHASKETGRATAILRPAPLSLQNGKFPDHYCLALHLTSSRAGTEVEILPVIDDVQHQATMMAAEAERRYPGQGWAHAYGASLFAYVGRTDDAIREYGKVLRAEPKSFDAYYGLGRLYEGRGIDADALANYRKAVEVGADRPERYLAHYGAAAVLHRGGDVARAVDEYQRAIQAFPSAPEIHHDLARAYRDLGKLDEAERVSAEVSTIYREQGRANAFSVSPTLRMKQERQVGFQGILYDLHEKANELYAWLAVELTADMQWPWLRR